jgi:hypothetical protein
VGNATVGSHDRIDAADTHGCPLFYCLKASLRKDVRREKKFGVPAHRERTEGERPVSVDETAREAVFRRERRPASLDRNFQADGAAVCYLAMQGESAVSIAVFSPWPDSSKE